VFENIKSLRPYFFSLREIEGNISLDMKLPLSWKYETIVTPYRSIKVKVQDKSEKFTLISLISNATQDGYDVVFACSLEIVNVNKEDEEKRKLFQEKVKELENLFQKETLNKLKDLNFLETYAQEDETSIELVGEGDGEGSIGGIEPQVENDNRGKKHK
jgi:hypothetical protein